MFLLLVGGSAFNLFVGLYEELRNIPLAEQGVWGEVLRTESALSLPSAQVPVLTAVMSLGLYVEKVRNLKGRRKKEQALQGKTVIRFWGWIFYLGFSQWLEPLCLQNNHSTGNASPRLPRKV